MKKLNPFEINLLSEYKRLYNQRKPSWAYEVAPSIPFVGNNIKRPRVLCYGSAENLTYLQNTKKNPIINIKELGEEQFYRHRYFLNNHKQDNRRFPYIHIQPINDGSLLSVIRYIVEKEYPKIFSFNPFDFIEEIAVGNFSKFSVDNRINVDTAGNKKKLQESIDYIIADLRELKPDLIIIPKTIFHNADKIMRWSEIKKKAGLENGIRVLKIYQTNSRVINSHITKLISRLENSSYESAMIKNWPVDSIRIAGIDKYFKWLEYKWSELKETI